MHKKMLRTWTGKKEPTNPSKKEQHQDRRTKREIQQRVKNVDWVQQLREFHATQSVQE